jgi:predicted amidohydrolase
MLYMGPFKIAAAQVVALRGDLERNIRTHAAAISAAAEYGVSAVMFPELSLIGYEPELAATNALSAFDVRLAPLAKLADQHRMQVVVGAPLSTDSTKPELGAILFGPGGFLRTYAKMHLGGSEAKYFTPGRGLLMFESQGQKVGLSICADSSAPSHPQSYAVLGATVYAAGVFLDSEWYATDAPRLTSYAPRHQMLVVMANHAASVGTYVSVGNSALWAPNGALLAQAADTENALVVATREPESWRGEVIKL